ncbi:2'-5' RNA ligase superfamily [Rubrobacter radiotolerans]|uniref:2'-5' RNA ligase family protein n=1 Tax=Rubrobacter radiotolerans TaxID=42256 RepID=A0A023X152_RUBRA|nr:2'-5' RNA ligase family protein [Rubrobacter radiotolerans]AHY45745.1 2'-5' RNA ligase superfamily [Rubrobacter radiotolerans]MDX5893162.1 2'-5' RNA ligase family protein [Rubrobacter radiotolerans]SMC03187.1 2'-5' RNA ligase [Rubrobacter radiotolerans DSM 5868]
MNASRPLILTLKLDGESQTFFDALRERHFPPERNFIPAHVSLFNQLPADLESEILSDVREACRRHEPFPVTVEKLRSLGRGVAYVLRSERLAALRSGLAGGWQSSLGPQDRQKFSPHVTVQNKVPPEEAKRLLAELQRGFEPFAVRAEGLLLWRYLGGPWEPVAEEDFGSSDSEGGG